jgi:hypothetical protein
LAAFDAATIRRDWMTYIADHLARKRQSNEPWWPWRES